MSAATPRRHLFRIQSRAAPGGLGVSSVRAPLLTLFACLLTACTSADRPATPEAAGSTRTPPASMSTSAVCGNPDTITSRVRAFIEAYNRGKSGLADQFFAPEPAFQWYSENGRREGVAAYDRSTLAEYLTQREEQADHLELLNVTPSSGGNFGFTVRRTAEPLPSKGAIDCRSGLFIVWSLGPNPGP